MLIIVSASAILFQRKSLRWAVPAAALLTAGLVGTGVLTAQASNPDLPPLSAAQLLADIEQAQLQGLSGTVVEKASLGLPELPDLGSNGGSNGSSVTSLLTGSHTIGVYYAGPTKQRLQLFQPVGETDVFHDGTDLWQWDSSTQVATHTTLPAADATHEPTPIASSTLTPQQLAQQALAAISPSTVVTTGSSRTVAGQDAYQLVLTPKDQSSRVGSVRIAIDAQYKIPLAVQVFARGDTSNAALDVSFTDVMFAVPNDNTFAFTPPKSATVKQGTVSDIAGAKQANEAANAKGQVQTIGSGWTSVAMLRDPALGSASSATAPGSGTQDLQSVLGALTSVKGSWGSGRLFESKLVSGLITSDGRIFVGAVDPQVLYSAAATHK